LWSGHDKRVSRLIIEEIPISTLFAFLHHLAAFMLVAALAIEFVLIGQIQINDAAVGLPIPLAKRVVIADAVLGAAAGERSSSFPLPALRGEVGCLSHKRVYARLRRAMAKATG
jgi:hypothetical protein